MWPKIPFYKMMCSKFCIGSQWGFIPGYPVNKTTVVFKRKHSVSRMSVRCSNKDSVNWKCLQQDIWTLERLVQAEHWEFYQCFWLFCGSCHQQHLLFMAIICYTSLQMEFDIILKIISNILCQMIFILMLPPSSNFNVKFF